MTVRYGMERSSPKRKDYADERPTSPNAVKARTAPEFVEYRPSSVYAEKLALCAAYRSVGKSWRPGE